MEKYEYDNNKKNSEKQSYSNTITDNKSNLISYSIIKQQNNIKKYIKKIKKKIKKKSY